MLLHIVRKTGALFERQGSFRVAGIVCSLGLARTLWLVSYDAGLNELLRAGFWGGLVMVAFAGIGSLLHEIVAPRRPLDLGLRLVWGASVVAALGGGLGALSWFGQSATSVMIFCGLVAAVYFGFRALRTLRRIAIVAAYRTRPLRLLVLLLLFALAIWSYCGAAADGQLNFTDDIVGYQPLVRRLLETGTLYEPFSERRALMFGGQTLFQAMLLVHSKMDQLLLFDSGLCKLSLVLLVWGHGYRRRSNYLTRVFAASLVLLLPTASINSASYFSGTWFILGLVRTVAWSRPENESPIRNAIPIALVGAAACTLRHNFLPIVGIVLLSAGCASFRFRNRLAWLSLGARAVSFICALGPWMWMAFRSEGTALFPLWRGNGNSARLVQSHDMSVLQECALGIRSLASGYPLSTFIFFFVASTLVTEKHVSKPLLALTLGVVGGFILLVHQLNNADTFGLARYSFPSFLALALFVVLHSDWEQKTPSIAGTFLASAACIIAIYTHREATAKLYADYWPRIEDRLRRQPYALSDDNDERVLRAQLLTPWGSPIALLNDHPAQLDYRRNVLYNLDLPGLISPPPGMPFFAGTRVLLAYLRGVGINFVLFQRANSSAFLYRRDLWLSQSATAEIFQGYGAYLLNLVQSLEELSRELPVLLDDNGLVLLDVRRVAK
jgi:hypothetical protein